MDADALSRRDQAAVDALDKRMAAAETRYREAMVAIGNADPDGTREADAALEDMEDVVDACIHQRGCAGMTRRRRHMSTPTSRPTSENPISNGWPACSPVASTIAPAAGLSTISARYTGPK